MLDAVALSVRLDFLVDTSRVGLHLFYGVVEVFGVVLNRLDGEVVREDAHVREATRASRREHLLVKRQLFGVLSTLLTKALGHGLLQIVREPYRSTLIERVLILMVRLCIDNRGNRIHIWQSQLTQLVLVHGLAYERENLLLDLLEQGALEPF